MGETGSGSSRRMNCTGKNKSQSLILVLGERKAVFGARKVMRKFLDNMRTHESERGKKKIVGMEDSADTCLTFQICIEVEL